MMPWFSDITISSMTKDSILKYSMILNGSIYTSRLGFTICVRTIYGHT